MNSVAHPVPEARRADLTLVAVDMGGTFLRTGSTYDRPRFARLRRRMRQEGVRFVLASSNQEAQLLNFFAQAHDDIDLRPGGVVSDSGATVVARATRLLETSVDMEALDSVPGLHKAAGWGVLFDHWDAAASQAASFGDSANDVEMARHSAHGIAMASASPPVCEAAWYVTASNDEDGVLAALGSWSPDR